MNQSMMALATRAQWVRSIVAVIAIGVIGTWLVVALTGLPWLTIGPMMAGVLVFTSLLAYRFSGRVNAFFYYKSFRVDKSESRYALSPDGVGIKSATFEGHFPWSAYHSIFRTGSHFLLWLNPMQAHIIPFRAIDENDVERVWSLVKDLPVARMVKVRV